MQWCSLADFPEVDVEQISPTLDPCCFYSLPQFWEAETRQRKRESREWGRPPIFTTLQFLPQTHSALQSCFHFALLHVMMLKLKQTALNGSNENDFALAGLWSRHVNSLQRFTAHTVLTQTVQGPNSCTWSAEEYYETRHTVDSYNEQFLIALGASQLHEFLVSLLYWCGQLCPFVADPKTMTQFFFCFLFKSVPAFQQSHREKLTVVETQSLSELQSWDDG